MKEDWHKFHFFTDDGKIFAAANKANAEQVLAKIKHDSTLINDRGSRKLYRFLESKQFRHEGYDLIIHRGYMMVDYSDLE